MIQSEYSKKHLVNLNKVLPRLTECFVSFYGEKYRPIIEERLNNVIIVFCNGYWLKPFHPLKGKPPKTFNPDLTNASKEMLEKYVKNIDAKDIKTLYDKIDKMNSAFSPAGEVLLAKTDNDELRTFLLWSIEQRTNDETFIHELVHVIESAIRKKDDHSLVITTGIKKNKEFVNGKVVELEIDTIMKSFEETLFNELLTEYKAYQIHSKYKEKGKVIINPEEMFSVCYRKSWFVTEPLLKIVLPYATKASLEGKKKEFVALFGGEKNYFNLLHSIYNLQDEIEYLCGKIRKTVAGDGIDINTEEDILTNINSLIKYSRKCKEIKYISNILKYTDIVAENISNSQL